MRQTFVRPEGFIDTATYALVGEQPGRTEIRLGKPFCGPAGKVLNDCLATVGIARSECYLTNVIKDLDRPLNHYFTYSNKMHTFSQEGNQYVQEIQRELREFNGVIVAIGNVAMAALTGRVGVTKWRGSVLEPQFPTTHKPHVIPCIHPATVIPPKNVWKNKLLIKYDIKKAKKLIEGTLKIKSRKLITGPSFDGAMAYLDYCYEEGKGGKTIDYDIELYNEEVSCISFSIRDTEAISIPFIKSNSDYFNVEQEATIWLKITEILQDDKVRKRGQNIGFDAHILLRKYGISAHNLDDTMVAQKTIMPDYPIGLDFITSIWTDHPYYKAEGKKYFGGGGWTQLWDYNATDSLICGDAFPKQYKEIVKQNNQDAYDRQRALIEPLVYMQEHGIRIDVEGMKKEYEYLDGEILKKREELNQLAGIELNPNSPQQVSSYFYGKAGKGIKPYKKRGTGKDTTDEGAMKRLKRRGFTEADIILQIRRMRKRQSTYLAPHKVDTDGRVRCSYNPVGTPFSRISSSKSIFGTGMNLQNIPQAVLKYLLADEGYLYYSFDLSQAENRIVAYVGMIEPMIQAFEEGKDVHALTGSLISNLSPDEVKRQDQEGIYCHIGSGDKTWRFWGKKTDHELNYDMGYRSFSYEYEIPERDGKALVQAYHSAYPGVRNSYHSMVRAGLAKDRTLTNLMGRKTLFLDEWGDKLFKHAYSCIPQGTVGDVINERGVNYIYYDQDQFRPVELLVQVHDSIGFQIPVPKLMLEQWLSEFITWKDHARILRSIKDSLEQPLETRGREFIIPADLTIGLNMSKKDGVEIPAKNFPSDDNLLAERLEEIWRNLNVKANTRGLA